jgi:hypothetical protein
MIFNLTSIANYREPFDHIFMHSVIPEKIFERVQVEAQRYPYFKVEQTRVSNPNRIWLNQQSGWLGAIAHEFDQTEVKSEIAYQFNKTHSRLRTRVELCMDSVGSWLEPHADDPAKEITLQLYLSGYGSSTLLGDRSTPVVPNMAWAFDNAKQPIHSLPPLKYNRASIIVNYVNDEWRDTSVLV